VREQFGDDLHPGDVILTNDPYKGMTVHLPDWGFIRPIFFEGELLFFTLVRGHQMDTGGSFPGGYFPNSFDIHAEGLCIPPTKVFENDKERSDVMRLIWNNVRWPEAVGSATRHGALRDLRKAGARCSSATAGHRDGMHPRCWSRTRRAAR
jgi:N-methylhydantoinase B